MDVTAPTGSALSNDKQRERETERERGRSVSACGGFRCWWPVFLSVAVTLPHLKPAESGASLPPLGPVTGQGLILNKETPDGQKTFSQTASVRGQQLLGVQHPPGSKLLYLSHT